MGGTGTVVDGNALTWLLLAVVAFSLSQGVRKGASGSARRLASFLAGAVLTIASVVFAAIASSAVSPRLQTWLTERNVGTPDATSSFFAQFGYTALTGLRDLPLFRFAALFLLFYALIRLLLGFVLGGLFRLVGPGEKTPASAGGAVSRAVGGAIGTALGAGRALLLTAALFAYCALFPLGPLTDYIQQSAMYREVASQVIRPATGNLLEERLPVFAQAMTAELDQLWQKRYDVIDADLPDDIVQAALDVTKGKTGDENKARALYDWVGSRIAYDNDKVRAYEELGEWREQNPEKTFLTRKGVCIDYARLYAAMARSAGLDVRVVTGLGYDGRGGYGAHAWNEVFSKEGQRWIPLDSTWARSGDWFDPPGFGDTHIRKGGLTG